MKSTRVVGREDEWSDLARFAAASPFGVRLGVVDGRRLHGKTWLVEALAEELGGFFHGAGEEPEGQALARFGRAVGEWSGGGHAFGSWEEALERLFATDGLFVIDDFPRLAAVVPSLPGLIVRASATGGRARRVLLCGTGMSGMVADGGPLRGWTSLELTVGPLDHRAAARLWGIGDPRLAVLVHSVVGGVPAYWSRFAGGDAPESVDDFDAWVLRAVLDPHGPLLREARRLGAGRNREDVHGPLAAFHEAVVRTSWPLL